MTEHTVYVDMPQVYAKGYVDVDLPAYAVVRSCHPDYRANRYVVTYTLRRDYTIVDHLNALGA